MPLLGIVMFTTPVALVESNTIAIACVLVVISSQCCLSQFLVAAHGRETRRRIASVDAIQSLAVSLAVH